MMSKENIGTSFIFSFYITMTKKVNMFSTKWHEMFARIIQDKDGNNGKQ